MVEPYLVDKPIGATPLEALALVRAARPEVTDAKLAYAGRLDPMATGLLVVLHGKLLADQESYWHLPKAYEATMVLGIVTDSYDLLGMPTAVIAADGMPTADRILSTVARLVGKHRLRVPTFSSHRIEGRPLFSWAREGSVDQDDIPTRPMAVNEIAVRDISPMRIEAICERVKARVPLVRGDFRQAEILAGWEETFGDRAAEEVPAIRLSIHCSAGTYIRSLSNALGNALGTGGMLIDLRRTHVGRWRVDAREVIRSGQLDLAAVVS